MGACVRSWSALIPVGVERGVLTKWIWENPDLKRLPGIDMMKS